MPAQVCPLRHAGNTSGVGASEPPRNLTSFLTAGCEGPEDNFLPGEKTYCFPTLRSSTPQGKAGWDGKVGGNDKKRKMNRLNSTVWIPGA